MFVVWLIVLFMQGLALVSAALADTRVSLTSPNVRLEYGDRSRGDIFTDTLRFVASDDAHVHATEAEITCDCVTGDVLPDGRFAFQFEVLAEELDGPTDKIVYVFTRHPELDLLRVELALTVLPGGPVPGTSPNDEPDAPDSGAGTGEGALGDEHTPPAPHGGKPPPRTTQPLDERRIDDPTQARLAPGEPVRLGFFHSPGCRTCARIKEHTLPRLAEEFGGRLAVESINLDQREGFARLMAVRDRYEAGDRRSSFLIAVGDTVFTTADDLYNRLSAAIARADRLRLATDLADDVAATGGDERGTEPTRSIFRSFSFWTVAGAGLLDGINPCAFATIVFFISLLTYAGSTRRQILIVGTGFTVAVFGVYLLLGLGAFRALQALAAYHVIARVIWALTLGLIALLTLLSLRDTVQYYRTGQTRDALLQLPRRTKQRIHKTMRSGLGTNRLLLASLGIGATVTLFEAACTGQVYLPAIVLMLNDPLMSERAWLYLVLYNVLFMAPLVVVFGLAYAGVGSAAFADWSKRHYGATRIALTALFVALGAVMVVQGW